MTHLALRLRLVDGTPTPILNPRATAAAILDRGSEALTYKLVDAEWDPPPRPTRDQLRAAILSGCDYAKPEPLPPRHPDDHMAEINLQAVLDALEALIHGDPTPDLSIPEET